MSFVRGGSDNTSSGKDKLLSPILGSGSGVGSVTNPMSSPKTEAFIAKGTRIVGNLDFIGPVEIQGHVEGEINCQDRMTIGESAVINARISGADIIVKGAVNGDITASRRILLQKPAKVLGNIKCASLGIEEGAIFEGKCAMEPIMTTATTTIAEPQTQQATIKPNTTTMQPQSLMSKTLP